MRFTLSTLAIIALIGCESQRAAPSSAAKTMPSVNSSGITRHELEYPGSDRKAISDREGNGIYIVDFIVDDPDVVRSYYDTKFSSYKSDMPEWRDMTNANPPTKFRRWFANHDTDTFKSVLIYVTSVSLREYKCNIQIHASPLIP